MYVLFLPLYISLLSFGGLASLPFWFLNQVNVSPKGLPSSSFSVLGPNLVAYIDATGSGCETIAHIYENGRVTIMFNSFDPSPRIMRLFCNGRVVEHDQSEFNDLLTRMGPDKKVEGARAIILLDVWKVLFSTPQEDMRKLLMPCYKIAS